MKWDASIGFSLPFGNPLCEYIGKDQINYPQPRIFLVYIPFVSDQQNPTDLHSERNAAEAPSPEEPKPLVLAPSTTITTAISVVCVILAALSYVWNDYKNPGLILIRMGANTSATFEQFELYRLFSSAFLHGDVIHLLVNMMALWSFGTLLEALLGQKRYLLLYSISALCGSLASALLRAEGYSVGASGAIWGLMAAGIGIAYWPRGLLPEPVVLDMRKRVWVPLVINTLYSFRPGIDWRAHFAGGIAGFVLVAFVLNRGLKPLVERQSASDIETGGAQFSRVGAWVMCILMGASVVAGLVMGKPWDYAKAPNYTRVTLPGTEISLELPTILANRIQVEQKANETMVVSFGDLGAAPMIIEVIYSRNELEGLPTEARDAFMQNLAEASPQQLPQNFKPVGKAVRTNVGGKDCVVFESKLFETQVKNYGFLQGARLFYLRFYFLDKGATGWTEVPERVVVSVRGGDAQSHP